jgi:uracil-DNA glycosylase family 4
MDFDTLVSEVKDCNRCTRMCGRRRVLSSENGNINAKVIFIAEAPGRLGAERTSIPLHGDAAGNNFEELLRGIGWERKSVFITNAVLCNPQDDNDNNDKPSPEEIRNCSNYLKRTIELINPDIIVTLGKMALNALRYIKSHKVILSQSVAQEVNWNNRIIFPLYHTGFRARRYRNLEQQRADFAALRDIISP